MALAAIGSSLCGRDYDTVQYSVTFLVLELELNPGLCVCAGLALYL